MTLRLVFMGTPRFSVATLEAIIAAGHAVAAVYAQPPRPAGRGNAVTKGAVHLAAIAHGIEVRTPIALKTPEAQAVFMAHGADAAVVVAYGLLLPQAILDAPRLGAYNLHASALPRWRGAAPIQRAIMAGDTATASVVMRMEAGLDTGPMCLVAPMAIGCDMTAGELHDALSTDGARLMIEALAALERGTLSLTPQPPGGITYAAKIEKAEARIDFTSPAHEVHNKVRGLSPFPGAWFEAGAGSRPERIKVLRSVVAAGNGAHGAPGRVLDDDLTIACGSGAIRLIEVQRAGKRAQTAAGFQRGFKLGAGTVLLRIASGD